MLNLLKKIKDLFIKPDPLNKDLAKKQENIRKLERIITCLKNCGGGHDRENCKKCPVKDYCGMFVEIIDNFGIGLNGQPAKINKV